MSAQTPAGTPQAAQGASKAAPPPVVPLSQDQQAAHDAILAWYRAHQTGAQKPLQILTLGGYAGTGKTTLIARLTGSLRAEKPAPTISFCCFTGKASLVLRQKLWKVQALGGSYCGTIHGMIYTPNIDPKTQRVIGWRRKGTDEIEGDLFILDEASMVDEKLLGDLQSYGRPILAVGDHGQLPPVSGTLNLMENPQIRLEHIHRQATGNPIIRVSILARESREIKLGYAEGGGGSVQKVPRGTNVVGALDDLRNTLFICGTNRTRNALNAQIRARLGYTGEPKPGERVICLRNNRDKGVYNGQMGTIEAIKPEGEHWYKLSVRMDGDVVYEDRASRHQFGQPKTLDAWPGLMPFSIGARFDWGYCVTAHKAQGSEHENVVVYEDYHWKDLHARWLYTALTRASKQLIIVGG